MISVRDIFHCPICGNIVEVLNSGAPALVCCGQPMNKLAVQTKDATTEKHVPYIEKTATGILVKVGKEVAHPMLEAHYIKFIEVLTKNAVYRAELKHGDTPEATFPISPDDVIEAREWCNIHGLWKSN